jgi:hypothetical protein
MASPEKQQLWVLSGYQCMFERARLGGSDGPTIGITVMVTLRHFADELSHSQIKFPFRKSTALRLTDGSVGIVSALCPELPLY